MAFAMFARGNPTGGFFGLSSSYAFARKSVGSRADRLYLTTQIALTNATIAAIASASSSWTAYCAGLTRNGAEFGNTPIILAGVDFLQGGPRWSSIAHGYVGGPSSSPAIVAHKWYIVEVIYGAADLDSSSILTCEGGWDYSSGQVNGGSVNDIRVGSWDAVSNIFPIGTGDTYEIYIGRVKCGTTRWGNDVFEDDFASGDFSAWDSHTSWTGTYGCEIVDRPAYPFFSASCNPFVERFGVHLAPVDLQLGNVPIDRLG